MNHYVMHFDPVCHCQLEQSCPFDGVGTVGIGCMHGLHVQLIPVIVC